MVFPLAAGLIRCCDGSGMRFFVGDDWAEDHHDIEVMDEAGRVLAKGRLPEGVAEKGRAHEPIGGWLGEDPDATEGGDGTETRRRPSGVGPGPAGFIRASGETP